MQRKRNNKGFTLAETLLVVAIIIILAALAFISIIAYQRKMTKLEYDGYAREIFIAAQNHLTMAESQGYLGLKAENGDFGTEYPEGSGIYYFVVSGSEDNWDSLLGLMLPVASIDETLRLGGCYIISYHKDSATVLNVFYWSPSGSRFGHAYADGDFEAFLSNTSKDALSRYGGNEKSVIGWYGGDAGASLSIKKEIKAPTIQLINAETLYVLVTDNNDGAVPGSDGYQLKLIVTGVTSGPQKSYPIPLSTLDLYSDGTPGVYKIVLDDITVESLRFHNKFGNLIPGEDISVKAMAYKSSSENGTGYNVAYSAAQITNSLFADGTTNADAERKTADTAKIAYFRHLENLDDTKSSLSTSGADIHITKAEQITNLVWTDNTFADAANSDFAYEPVSPSYALQYNGASPLNADGTFIDGTTVIHSISNLTVSSTGFAGVFGELKVSGTEIKNLKLIDLTVSGAGAGALAGKTKDTNVTNVVAYNSKSFDDSKGTDATVTGSASAGGLIGTVDGGTISKCAAALVVSGGSNAGGLIGTVDGGSVSSCYSGGHTTDGNYSSTAFNVTSTATDGNAGGLIGSFDGTKIENSYSTCSASGATVGGFVGTASGSIANCYATGLVSGTAKGAFAGSLSGSASDCYYYEIINELDKNGLTDKSDDNYGKDGFMYLSAVPGAETTAGISRLDANAKAYQDFVGNPSSWESAVPYDTQLYIYKGKYSLKAMPGMTPDASGNKPFVATHYGDWPAPEVWVINR